MSRQDCSTIDEDEVRRHAELLDAWWKPSGPMKGLHSFNRVRIPLVLNELAARAERNSEAPLTGKAILDIGCGGGIVAEALAKLGARVSGVDPSRELIQLAREHSRLDEKVAVNPPTYYCTTVEEHAKLFPEHYDAVVASEVVEHVADVDLFLKNCTAVLKPGGKLFITTPTRTRIAQFLVIFVGENVIKSVPKGLHQYEKFTRPREVASILQKYDCKVDKTRGIFYLPFLDKWLLVLFRTVWYALVATKTTRD